MEYMCLVVDDDLDIAKTTAEYFNIFDIKTAYVTSYDAALSFIKENKVSLILLDINLGEASGFELCKSIRKESDLPILFISARTSDDDVLTALNIGGDDYIKKPYTLNILLAKVKVVLKRYEKQKIESMSEQEAVSFQGKEQIKQREENSQERTMPKIMPPIQISDTMQLDTNYHQLVKEGKVIKLKEMEFRLIKYLVENRNRVISKDELFEKVWEDNFVGDGTLSVHIRHLREKMEDVPNEPKYIKTVWGIGYVFELLE